MKTDCPICNLGLTPVNIICIPVKENGIFIDKYLQIKQGGSIYNQLLSQNNGVLPQFISDIKYE